MPRLADEVCHQTVTWKQSDLSPRPPVVTLRRARNGKSARSEGILSCWLPFGADILRSLAAHPIPSEPSALPGKTPVQSRLTYLLVLIVPLAAVLAPGTAVRAASSVCSESEESPESESEGTETLAPGRRDDTPSSRAPARVARNRITLSGRVLSRRMLAAPAVPASHCWHNGLSAPLRT